MIKQGEITNFSAQPGSTDYTTVPLETGKSKTSKFPRRLIHFSDGLLEEYSTDEDDDEPPPQPLVDPKTLTWGPWFGFYMKTAAFKTLGVAESCGENLAWFFGITSPKYQHAINEFYRLKAEEEKEVAHEMRLREYMQGLSSVDVKVIEQPRDTGSGNHQPLKF